MNLENINENNLVSNKSGNNFLNKFVKELSDYLNIKQAKNEIQEIVDKRNEIMTTTNLEEGKIYVVSDISDNEISVVDIENGDEIQVYISTNENNLKELNNKGIYDRIYQMDKTEFLNLNLTDNITVKNNKLYSNTDKIEIKNNLAWRLLSDLYIGERETERKKYEVVGIKENKIYLTNADGKGGYSYIYKELYPDFEVGDIIQKSNRKYIKIEE